MSFGRARVDRLCPLGFEEADIRRFGLAHLTAWELTAPELVRLAAELGYDDVGIRLSAMVANGAPDGRDNPALLRETRAALAGARVRLFDVDVIRLGPGADPSAFAPFLDAAAELGAQTVLAVGEDREIGRLVDSFAGFCRIAAGAGLSVDLEFMPWTSVPDLATARHVVAAADQPNAGLLVDPLHFFRTGGAPADLLDLPAAWLRYVQLCDAPAAAPADLDGLVYAARHERLFPGQGDFDLVSFMRAFPCETLVSVETPNESLGLDARERARQGLAAARAVMDQVDAARATTWGRSIANCA